MEFLTWMQDSGFATWVREADSSFAYTLYLALHGIGLAFLVGPNVAIDLRILGFAPRLPLAPMERFFRLMYAAFWLNALSGVVLFICEATRFVAIPVYWIKLVAVALAVVNIRLLRSRVFGNPENLGTKPVPTAGRILAGTSLGIWAVAIWAGRVTAYDGYIQWETGLAVLIAAAVMLLAGSLGARLLGWRRCRVSSIEPGARLREGL